MTPASMSRSWDQVDSDGQASTLAAGDTAWEEVEVLFLGDNTAKVVDLVSSAGSPRSEALGIRRTSEMLHTPGMWMTMTFIELAEAVLDPALVHEHPFGELPVCCVHEMSTGNAPREWDATARLIRRFANPNAKAPSSRATGDGGAGADADGERLALGPVLLALVAPSEGPVNGKIVTDENAKSLMPPAVQQLLKEYDVEPCVLSAKRAEAMVQVYWWAIQTYRRQHPEHNFTLDNVKQVVRMLLADDYKSPQSGAWCVVS